jgi:membrane protease YdiL (CAAX protease family)
MQTENLPVPLIEGENNIIVPWSVREILLSFLAIILISAGIFWAVVQWPESTDLMMVLYQVVFVVPVILILWRRGAKINLLGLRNFKIENLALGCGLLLGTYILIMLHNLLLMLFGIAPQGEYLSEFFNAGESVGLFVFVGIVLAPLVEEIFFRGFLFGGLHQKYGWKKAAVISAAIFSIGHLQLAILIPAFLLGLVFAYLYHRSNSIFPGMILHLIVNSFTFGMLYLFSLLEPLL